MSLQGFPVLYLKDSANWERSLTHEEWQPTSKMVKRKYKLIRLTAVHVKVMEQILLEHISGHKSEKNVLGNIVSMDLPCINHA